MDREIKDESGFTLIELIIVVAIVGILVSVTVTRFDHLQTVNEINEDMHRISSFIHAQKMLAFTQKQSVQLTVAGSQITTIIDPGGTNTAGLTLALNNTLRATGSPFTIDTRGTMAPLGDISINAVNTGAEFSCVKVAQIRIRLGVWNGANCTPL